MQRDTTEEQGRFLLRALLWLVFICAVAGQVLYYGALNRDTALYIATALVPTAVALWALHRGSWPGLVLFFIASFHTVANVTGALSEGGREAMGSPAIVVEFISLLLRLTVVFCVLRPSLVSQYLLYRRTFRRRRDDVIEIGLFVLFYALFIIVALSLPEQALY